MRPITPVALAVGIETPIALQAHEAYAVLYNESSLNLTVITATGSRTLPAWTGDLFDLQQNGGGGVLSVMPTAVLNQANPPASSLTGDIFYDTERPRGVYPIALARQVSVGNQVSTTSSDSVINDGNPAGTHVVEGTPSGASASELLWSNDGSGIFGGGNDVVDATGKFTSMPADAIPAAAIAAGTLDTDVTVPAANLSGTLPASQVGTGYPAADLTGSVPSATQLEAAGGSQAAVVANYGGSGSAHGYLSFPYGGGTLTGHKAFSGTGAGTFTHGLAVTPDFVGITTTEGTNSTETVGVDSIGSTTCHVDQGVSGWPWVGIATKN